MLKITSFLFSFFFATMAFASQLEVYLENPNVVLLNATSRSCELQITDPHFLQPDDLVGTSFTLGSFGVKWNGTHPLNLQYVQIHLEGTNLPKAGVYLNPIAGTDLAWTWAGSGQMYAVPGGMVASSTPNCRLDIGGVPLVSKTENAFGTGTFEVYGTTTDDQGKVIPASGTTTLRFQYTAP